jgi:putative PIN family toxin of toxin-antitoxin system
MRIIIDANAWISSLLKPSFQIRLEVFFDSKYHLIVSEGLFKDLASAICKPYLARRINRTHYENLVSRLRTHAALIDVHSVVDVCRDPKDNFLLALAKDGDANYLITGDEDLQVLETFEKTKIMSLSDFEKMLSEK